MMLLLLKDIQILKPDKPLIELLSIANGESIGYYNFNTYINRLYDLDIDDQLDEDD